MYIELLKIFTPAIVTILAIFIKSYVDNKGLLKKIETIDKTQNEQISEIKDTLKTHVEKEDKQNAMIESLNDLLKYQPFYGKLSNSLTSRVYKLTKGLNPEVSDMLFRSLQAVKPYFEELLKTDFEGIQEEIIYLEIKSRAKNVRSSINCNNLNLTDFQLHNFMSNLSFELKQPIRKFAYELAELAKIKRNGERRAAFELLCIDLINLEINITINAYSEINKAA